jgi:predicted RND superfamily exporter protein
MGKTETLMKNHYLKPKLFALALLVISLGMIFGGFFMESETYDMNYFGVAFIGIFFLIMSLVTFFVYNNLQKKLNALLDAKPLMAFVLTEQQAALAIEENNEALKSYNTKIWLTIVGFCALFAIAGPLFAEDWGLWAMICLGIAVFFTFVFLIATAYRINRFKKADHNVVLNEKGVYFMGQYYTFGMTGVWLTESSYDPQKALLKLVVTAATTAGPADSTLIIPIPDEYKDQIINILTELPASPF